ncbi:zf-HC2 domain-containing protein [Planotetraspora sp. A-T 1434]|uniref:anti-sigma factor family protein n=1 Tax=Planotetraspora sp. A-T 1434 TaxID=2979219 RepID=UPI0021C24B0B|nr:zf-HC2 domain-containing protein [Planotetraspora sp. A-T 1434]MCT9932602.1 zf-HC2 domain-containing protein [Planotetraspora sp. A-T 1434]
MSHLGERVSALIDGELGHNDRERALAHLTFCADCRAEVDALRTLKSRLRSMDPPAMPVDLTMSLLRMSEPGGPLPPRMRPFPDHPAFASNGLPGMHGIAPLDNRPRRVSGSSGPGRSTRTRRAGYVAVGVASAAVALGTMFMVGGSAAHQDPSPVVLFNQAPLVKTSPTPSHSVTPEPSR